MIEFKLIGTFFVRLLYMIFVAITKKIVLLLQLCLHMGLGCEPSSNPK